EAARRRPPGTRIRRGGRARGQGRGAGRAGPSFRDAPDVVVGGLFDEPALPFGLQFLDGLLGGAQYALHRVVGDLRPVPAVGPVGQADDLRQGQQDGFAGVPAVRRRAAGGRVGQDPFPVAEGAPAPSASRYAAARPSPRRHGQSSTGSYGSSVTNAAAASSRRGSAGPGRRPGTMRPPSMRAAGTRSRSISSAAARPRDSSPCVTGPPSWRATISRSFGVLMRTPGVADGVRAGAAARLAQVL